MSEKRQEIKRAALSRRENRKNKRDIVDLKQKPQRSFSIPRKQRIRGPVTTEWIHQEKVDDMNQGSSSSTYTEWQTNDGKWETDVSVEQMRSSEMLSLNEIIILPPLLMLFRDSEFNDLHLDAGQMASTPLSRSKEESLHFSGNIESIKKAVLAVPSTVVGNVPQQHGEDLDIPDVSYINENGDESETLTDFDFRKISFEDATTSDNEDDFENVQSIQNEESEVDEVDNIPPETVTHERIRKYNKRVRNGKKTQQEDVNRKMTEQNFDLEEDGVTILKSRQKDNRKGKNRHDKIGNSLEYMDPHNSRASLEDRQNIQTDTPKKKTKFYRDVRMKSTSRMGRLLERKAEDKLFKDENKSDTEDSFENVQNTQNDELEGDFLDKTFKPRNVSKTKQDFRIGNESQNSNQRKQKDKVKNSSEDESEESQDTETRAPPKTLKHRGSFGVKRYSLGNKSRKTSNHTRTSKSAQDVEASEHFQNSQNEDKDLEWPLCCLLDNGNCNFPVLKPVIRYDVPIDSIMMLCLGNESKERCKHKH